MEKPSVLKLFNNKSSNRCESKQCEKAKEKKSLSAQCLFFLLKGVQKVQIRRDIEQAGVSCGLVG